MIFIFSDFYKYRKKRKGRDGRKRVKDEKYKIKADWLPSEWNVEGLGRAKGTNADRLK